MDLLQTTDLPQQQQLNIQRTLVLNPDSVRQSGLYPRRYGQGITGHA